MVGEASGAGSERTGLSGVPLRCHRVNLRRRGNVATGMRGTEARVRSDAPRFEDEFDRLFGRAFAVARRLTGDPAAAEDIAAEALARTYARWHRVRSFEYRDAWVARVATNLAIDAARRRRIDPAALNTADPSDATVLRLALVEALSHLPRRQREAVALRYLADLSVDDVAVSLGVSAGTVKQSVHRGLKTLRDRLGPDMVAIGSEEQL